LQATDNTSRISYTYCARARTRVPGGGELSEWTQGQYHRIPSRILMVIGTGLRGDLENGLLRQISNVFASSVPVVVHQYGLIRSGVIFRTCQRVATRRLAERLRQFAHEDANRMHGRLDIIGHSFGAWLVGEALKENPDLRVGRIILAGSVVRPDFDWNSLILSNRVEAVLNHCGGRDIWVRVSEFFIPGSGPSGLHGFAECSGVFNRIESQFMHKTFFELEQIDDVHQGLWKSFLTRSADELWQLATPDESRAWRPRPWVLRANLLRAFLLLGLAMGTAGLLLCLAGLLIGVVT
jgi:hypothetical protein